METEKSPFGKYHTLSQSETMNGKIGVTKVFGILELLLEKMFDDDCCIQVMIMDFQLEA